MYDVVVVGAGLSGIGTAYWLQEKCPDKEFVLLEARSAIGGTWDLFRYPGVRSDSDMFTFGYAFRPWESPKSIADGASIREYIAETARVYGIDRKIRFRHRVLRADWSSAEASWTLQVEDLDRGETRAFRTRWLYMCSGYYSYEEAHRPHFAGEETYGGRIVQPQFWPEDLDYSGQRVVVVGSGATAVTLVPAMAGEAAHVTMLQRSPTYVLSLPASDGSYWRYRRWLPDRAAYRLTRWKNLLFSMVLYQMSRWFPQRLKRLIKEGAARELGPEVDVDTHFNPSYDPWDQRLCIVPGADLFRAIRSGQAAVVTDRIERFTETGLRLESGQDLPADIIVLATGLKIKLLGGARLTVDGRPVKTGEAMVYRGMMMSDVPNFSLAVGYTNASWTLKTDLTANYVCRLLNYMDRHGYAAVTPQRQEDVQPEPLLDLDSNYIKRASDILPKQGDRAPWRVYQNYLLDLLSIRYGRVADRTLHFSGQPESAWT